jgi:TolA-binding protein
VSVVGLHPEDLFDKEERGTITPAESRRLHAHVAQCAVCRVEREMRLDFADELSGEDPRISVSGLLALANLDGAAAPRAAAASQALAGAGRVRVKRATWLLVAAAVCVASVAGAAGATGIGQRAWSRLVGTEVVTVAAPAPTAKETPVKHAPRRAAPAAAPAPEPVTLDVLASSPEPARTAAHVTHVESASSVFEQASLARRHGDYTKALRLERELQSRFPASREAHVARATTGQLLLDLGDPSGALSSFESYLTSGSGELGEAAMVGRATALERLGRSGEARRAWQALLAAFPDSPYAAHAKRRLSTP